MPSYRLLRSNKESGPYSLNDLVTLGLKPYDLVWVDGRSAAWRYPSEITELKDYAPAIEEQPYDRFYKKSTESEIATKEPAVPQHLEPVQRENPIKENIIKQEPSRTTLKEEPVKVAPVEAPNPVYQNYQPQKKVFVSMPDNNGFKHHQEQYQQYLPKPKPAQEKQLAPVQEKEFPVEKTSYPEQERSYSPIDIREPDDAKLETKYTQSLDDIKEMYINTLVQRKTKNRRKEIFRKYVKPALVPLFLLISGVAIGFVINYKKSPKVVQALSTVTPQENIPAPKDEQVATDEKTEDQVLQPEEKQNEEKQTEQKQHTITVTNNKTKKQVKQPAQVSIESEKHNKPLQLFPKAVVPEKKQKEAFVPDEVAATYQKKDVQVNPNTGERTRTMRDNDESNDADNNARTNSERSYKKATAERTDRPTGETDRRSSIRDFVSVKTNNYVRGSFGGIRGLELMVYNTSDFLVDEVSIELQIMKPSEQPLRTDLITVRNISPNGTVRVRVPDSQRGIRVDYRITHVESRQWQRSTAGL